MHVDQEWVCVCVCGNLKYSTQKTQYKHDTLMDTWKRDNLHSSERFLDFRHTVVLIGVFKPAGIF